MKAKKPPDKRQPDNHVVGCQQVPQQHDPVIQQGASVCGIQSNLAVGVAKVGSSQAKLGEIRQGVDDHVCDGVQVTQFINDPPLVKAKKPPDKRQPDKHRVGCQQGPQQHDPVIQLSAGVHGVESNLVVGVAKVGSCQCCGPVVLKLHGAQQDLHQGDWAHDPKGGNSFFPPLRALPGYCVGMCFFFCRSELNMTYLDRFMSKEVAVNMDNVIVTLINDQGVCSYDSEDNKDFYKMGTIQKIYNPILFPTGIVTQLSVEVNL